MDAERIAGTNLIKEVVATPEDLIGADGSLLGSPQGLSWTPGKYWVNTIAPGAFLYDVQQSDYPGMGESSDGPCADGSTGTSE